MAKKKKLDPSELLVDAIVEGMQNNKAQDITILDLRQLDSAVCDFFVICSGESSTQVWYCSICSTPNPKRTQRETLAYRRQNKF